LDILWVLELVEEAGIPRKEENAEDKVDAGTDFDTLAVVDSRNRDTFAAAVGTAAVGDRLALAAIAPALVLLDIDKSEVVEDSLQAEGKPRVVDKPLAVDILVPLDTLGVEEHQ
jgi:hypothetical protein